MADETNRRWGDEPVVGDATVVDDQPATADVSDTLDDSKPVFMGPRPVAVLSPPAAAAPPPQLAHRANVQPSPFSSGEFSWISEAGAPGAPAIAPVIKPALPPAQAAQAAPTAQAAAPALPAPLVPQPVAQPAQPPAAPRPPPAVAPRTSLFGLSSDRELKIGILVVAALIAVLAIGLLIGVIVYAAGDETTQVED